jgi:GNAT superfamily N-acetyltransferase
LPVDIVPVRGNRALARFVALPWSLHDRTRYPQWVPPLRAMVKDGIDERGNPFYQNAERELFMACRAGRPVGRIAAIHSQRHNEYHEDRVGFFGFFESVNDPEVAHALVDAAAEWLRERGLDRIRGPISPSMHDECGLLIDGFDQQATFMTAWNPPYYSDLVDATGLAKVKDLVAFWIPFTHGVPFPERFTRALERVRKQSGFTFRQLDRSRFAREVELAWDVYNEAWERNWGFVPMTRAEFDHMAGMLKLLVVDQFACFAEVNGEAAGFAMALPDYNRTLQRIPGGRLLPFGLPMLLRDRTRLRTGRALLLGVKERFRRHNIYFLLLYELLKRAHAYGATGADASWILEDNDAMLAFFREAGIPANRRWRIYEKPITSA